ncbi:MAG TPA: ATP-binding protein [Candidatus Limnocylindrales bacterium]|nr:ATP-binding protein [Candidatus Limnocylindrales bacterium]
MTAFGQTLKSSNGVPTALLIAAVATTAIVVMRWLLDPWLPGQFPFVTTFSAVAAAAYYGGWLPALLSAVFGFIACGLLFTPLAQATPVQQQLVGFGVYAVTCSVLIILAEATRNAQRVMHAEHERLSTTLASIGDGVITTDADARVIYLNGVAEALTGWTQADAAAQPLEDVFAVINEHTQQRIDNPATSALREGAIMGLANHTVLLSKDGRSIPIDDSAAPIRDRSGRVVGCVLIFRDVAEKRRADRELAESRANLQAADRRKDEFLATLAHELRNPLAPIRNSLQIMRLAGDDKPVVEQAVATMERQVDQMVHLVDDLLDVARISRGKIELRRERVELAGIVQQAVDLCRPLAENMRHEIRVSLPAEPLHLQADAVRLSQVLGNLIHNACKYTERGGRIELVAEPHDGELVVAIKDTGIGIPPDMLPRVFEMFTQVDQTRERAQGGLGIGLTLAKELVEMHGGTIEVHSEGRGRGTEVVVRLPLMVEHQSGRERVPSQPGHTSPVWRILVVDDNEDSAESLSMLLRLQGHDSSTAHDGPRAIELAEQIRPELVLLDIGLPRMNGLEVCRRIREQAWGRTMIVVALTGWGQEEDRLRSKEAGFDHHLVKPVQFAELTRMIASLAVAPCTPPG